MTAWSDVLIISLLVPGVGFIILASIGLLRMPDIYTRMSTTSKAASLGTAFTLAAVAAHFGSVAVTTRVVAAVAFLFLTIPVAAHLIGRAAYFVGVPLWDKTIQDDLKGRYDEETHELDSDVPGLAPRHGP